VRLLKTLIRRRAPQPEVKLDAHELELIAKAEAELDDELGRSSDVVARVPMPKKSAFIKGSAWPEPKWTQWWS
jgi:hypothetical protein